MMSTDWEVGTTRGYVIYLELVAACSCQGESVGELAGNMRLDPGLESLVKLHERYEADVTGV